MTDHVIRLDNVSRVFKSNGSVVNAVSSVSFAVPGQSIWVLAGPSGSGKTTLLNLIGGMDRPTSGEIIVGNYHLNQMDEKELALFRRFHVGFIFQGNNLIPTFTVYENVELPLLLTSAGRMDEKIKEMLDTVGLKDRASFLPRRLSGGEEQRVAIARALVHSPSVVLADEPTANLDSETAADIFDLLLELNDKLKTIIVFATHDPMIVDKANNVLKLADGKIVGK